MRVSLATESRIYHALVELLRWNRRRYHMGMHVSSKGRSQLSWMAPCSLVLSVILVILLRSLAFDLPLETDECNYIYIAARLLDGDRLYLDVWDHQPFGVFALFAGVIALFGQQVEVFRWLAVVFSLLSLVLVFLLAKREGGPAAGALASILFALACIDPGSAGEGCNREIFMTTFVLAAWLFVGRSPMGNMSCLLSGTALAIGSTIKTVLAVHWLVLALWIIWILRAEKRPVRTTAVRLLCFAFAPAIVWLAALIYFAATSRLSEFTDAVFLFNLSYSDASQPFFWRFLQFLRPERHPFVFDTVWPVWVLGAGATFWLGGRSVMRNLPAQSSSALLVIASYLAVCLPGRFWPHYYYLMIAPLCVVTGVCVGKLLAERGLALRRCTITVTALLLSVLAFRVYSDYVSQPLFGLTVHRYNSRDFWGRAHGRTIEKITREGDTIFVYGNEAEFYYYSNRRCASRFTMITGLHGADPRVDERRRQLLDDLKENQPVLIAVLFDEQPFPEWRGFLNSHYTEPIGWDLHDRTGRPIMFVVARKGSRLPTIDWNWDRSQVGGWFASE